MAKEGNKYAIIYDVNFFFAVLEFSSPPLNTLKANVEIFSDKRDILNYEYDVSFEIPID